MLQDIEAGRAIEADALLGSVIELGVLVGVATARLDAIYAVVKLLGETQALQIFGDPADIELISRTPAPRS